MDKKIIIGFILITLVVIVSSVFLLSTKSSSVDILATADAKVEVGQSSYDWGEIGINDGNVEKEFNIKNGGTEPLNLYNVSTSCMCTTARLILGDKESPEFGMHDESSYILEVPPGKTAKLKVIFDPAFHGPNGVGPINRQVLVETNDMNNPEITFMLTAMVRN